MLPLPGKDQQVSPYIAFYIVIMMQVGIAILSFERHLVKDAGHDMWVSVLIGGVSIHLFVWIMYQVLNKGNNDIAGIHRQLFGKWVGGLLSLLLIAYIFSFFLVTIHAYIEVIQIWMFPQLQTWYLAIVLAAVTYLYLTGGFRVVAGLCVISFFLTIPLLSLKVFPLNEGSISHLFPMLDHSFMELSAAAKKVILSYSGFEILLFCYPFFKDAPSSHKWAQWGVFGTTVIYLITVFVSVMYFTEEHLFKVIWPTLTMWKIVDLPFMERLEYAGIALWVFTILPKLCLSLWAVTRGLKQMFSIQQKKSFKFLLALAVFLSILLGENEQTDSFLKELNKAGLYVIYAYLPFLYVYQLIYSKWRERS